MVKIGGVLAGNYATFFKMRNHFFDRRKELFLVHVSFFDDVVFEAYLNIGVAKRVSEKWVFYLHQYGVVWFLQKHTDGVAGFYAFQVIAEPGAFGEGTEE